MFLNIKAKEENIKIMHRFGLMKLENLAPHLHFCLHLQTWLTVRLKSREGREVVAALLCNRRKGRIYCSHQMPKASNKYGSPIPKGGHWKLKIHMALSSEASLEFGLLPYASNLLNANPHVKFDFKRIRERIKRWSDMPYESLNHMFLFR